MSALDWVQAIATVLAVGLAAISAWRSEIAAKATQTAARKNYELDLVRAYPVLRIENHTIGDAVFPADHKLKHLEQWGGALVVFLTLRNVGGTAAVVDWLELSPEDGQGGAGSSLSQFTASSYPGEAVRYIPGDYSGKVVIEPGAKATVGAWFAQAPRGKWYVVRTRADAFPPVSLRFKPLVDGGTHSSKTDQRRPVTIIEDWIESNSSAAT